MSCRVIAFVDIDGVPTPIDDSYRRLPALLASLASERLVLIFCSSRTRAEVEGFRQRIGVFHPFICENGAAAFVPGQYFGSPIPGSRGVAGYEAIEFGLQYDTVVDIVHRVADQLKIGVRGFSDMSVEQVARECGLSLLDARLAKLREYGEPFRLLVDDPAAERRLVKALENAGLKCVRRGELLHASSLASPALAIDTVTRLYQSLGPAQAIDAGAPGPSPDSLGWIEDLMHRIVPARHSHQRMAAAQAAR